MKFIATFITLFAIWVALTFTGLENAVQELIVGGLTTLVLAGIISKYVNYSIDAKFPIKLLLFIVVYVPKFVWELIKSNIDIARRVLSFKIPLNPGIVKVKTDLKGDMGKLVLANSITLTPGTLSIDVDGDDIYVHCVDVKGETQEEHKEDISASFEKTLKGIFN